jgi:hypothetical protein
MSVFVLKKGCGQAFLPAAIKQNKKQTPIPSEVCAATEARFLEPRGRLPHKKIG